MPVAEKTLQTATLAILIAALYILTGPVWAGGAAVGCIFTMFVKGNWPYESKRKVRRLKKK